MFGSPPHQQMAESVVTGSGINMLRYAKLLLSSLRQLDPWRRLLAALVSVNTWSLYYEVELAWVLFQLEPEVVLRTEPKVLASLLRGRVRNLATSILGTYTAAKVSSKLEELVSLAHKEPEVAREWLVRSVYGLGRKGASMFLRDSRVKGIYPLDRHVLRWVYGLRISETEMNKIWSTSWRYRRAELDFEAKVKKYYPGMDPALVNILIFANGSSRTSFNALIEYINCIRFFAEAHTSEHRR